MNRFDILSRRAFLDRSFKISMGVALSTLVDIPFVVKRALAEGNIGLNGKKVLFIFLRGANDGLNTIVPVKDDNYYSSRLVPAENKVIGIPKDATAGYDYGNAPIFDPTQYLDVGGTARTAASPTFSYGNAISLGNGFAGLHPSLKFLAPVYQAGDLALIHRVGYPRQSRSHFDSQNYWENGNPNNNLIKDGIFYRAMIESGLTTKSALTGVSVQSSLPLLLRGSGAAMTNLADPTRYNLFGIPNSTAGNTKADNYFAVGNTLPSVDRKNRDLLDLQFKNLSDTLQIFSQIPFSSQFYDNVATDGDLDVMNNRGYNLFPTSNPQNGGSNINGRVGDTTKYVVDTGAYSLFTNLKSAALILNKTDAIVAGTEFSGFDTHTGQGGVTGNHANLLRRIGWAMYALRKYFLLNGDRCTWNNLVVVTLSEFGRTSVQNGSTGTDHAEAGAMFVAGGGVQGFARHASGHGVFGCSTGEFGGNDTELNWLPNPQDAANASNCGTLWAASPKVVQGYLKRQTDYRSVLGEVIRKHLGAAFDTANPYSSSQLSRIIPGYGSSADALYSVGTASDGTKVRGEVGFLLP